MGAAMRAPIDNLGQPYLDQLQADVASRVVHGAEQVPILVDPLERHLHVAIQEARFHEVASLTCKRLRLLRTVRLPTEPTALDARKHERHLVESWQEEDAKR